jgi:hypothetical protein
MKPVFVLLLKVFLFVGVLSTCLVSSDARAQIQVTISPPAWFISTAAPVYYDGHVLYWYGDRWYFRHGNSWRYYTEEPVHLREYRRQHRPVRYFYGRNHRNPRVHREMRDRDRR